MSNTKAREEKRLIHVRFASLNLSRTRSHPYSIVSKRKEKKKSGLISIDPTIASCCSGVFEHSLKSALTSLLGHLNVGRAFTSRKGCKGTNDSFTSLRSQKRGWVGESSALNKTSRLPLVDYCILPVLTLGFLTVSLKERARE
jgi:hypothetical protein